MGSPSTTVSAFGRRLEAALSNYVPTDPRELHFRERMLELGRHAHASERQHFEPGHFTASAFVLSPERDSVLLIFHRKLHKWLQPGGHIEPGDASPLDSARREVEEEVGLSASDLATPTESIFDIDIHPIPARANEPAHEHFDVRFVFVASTRLFAAAPEVVDAKWVAVHAVSRSTDDESVLRAIRKLDAFRIQAGP